MSGIKFKVGDRVNWLHGPGWTDCEVIEANDRYVRVRGDAGIGLMYLNEIEFAAASADLSPVRTVTRREIVPGRYGIVSVSRTQDGRLLFDLWKAIPSAAELREVARIFNEIADVLDENVKIGEVR